MEGIPYDGVAGIGFGVNDTALDAQRLRPTAGGYDLRLAFATSGALTLAKQCVSTQWQVDDRTH